jgi:hypothetical protein
VGYDAAKKVKGRKIHALVDTDGLPMQVVVHSAAIQDRDGAGLVIDKIHRRSPWLELIRADDGYNAWLVEAAGCRAMGVCKRRDKIARYVIANDRDAAMSGRWGGPELTGQIDPKPTLGLRAGNGSSC